jgi:hypothetical protein
MARPSVENRHTVAEATLTLRLTRRDRQLLEELVAMKAEELADSGVTTTVASYVRGLIRREAKVSGLVAPKQKQQKRVPATARYHPRTGAEPDS